MGKTLNVKNLHFAEVTENADGTLTFGTPDLILGLEEVTRTPQVARGTQYGDGILREEEIKKTAYNMSVKHNDIPQKWRRWMEGTKYVNGVGSGTSEDKPKPFAMGYENAKCRGRRQMVWFPYCKASPIESTESQNTENINISSDTITITAFEHDSIKRYYTDIDSSDEAVTPAIVDNFFTQVQVKDIIEAPEPATP